MGGKKQWKLVSLQREIAGCTICTAHLPLGPNPVTQFSSQSKIVIIGQAPGTRVHESGVPWDDPSGDHLREWFAVSKSDFYDPNQFALVPMGFCYPGRVANGDAPPRPECAPQWHKRILSMLPSDAVIVLAGQYAQQYYLQKERKKTVTETVAAFAEYLPRFIPLPHPSWRSRLWIKKNPWFETELLPVLRRLVPCSRQKPGNDTLNI